MIATPRLTLPRLGFGPWPPLLCGLLGGAVAAGCTGLAGGTPAAMAAAGLGSIGTAAAAWAWWLRRLDRRVLEPLEGFANALVDLTADRPLPEFPGALVPAVAELQERLRRACSQVQRELKVSRANLMSAEAAFGRLNSVLQSLEEGVLVLNGEGRVVLANAAARRAMTDDGDWLGRPLEGMFADGLADAMGEVSRSCRAGSVQGIHFQDLVQGERFYALSATDVTHGEDDAGFDHVIVVMDVTREHEINRLKDRLLSSISHELRTPLTNMVSFCEILTKMTPERDEDWLEFVNILNTESVRLKDLVDNVFDYCQVEVGELEWNVERQDARQVVIAVRDMFRDQATAKGQRFTVETPETPLMAEFDFRRALMATARIVDNAIKFTPEGGEVRIAMDTEADTIRVRVADSGPGIPGADRERVFERFQQLGDIETGKPDGAGLGLATSQQLVQRMGGTIRCGDSPLGGAEITFTLPLAPAHPGIPGQIL